jgi:phospholipid/cholesterol/gamma-HCH transport system permease protein
MVFGMIFASVGCYKGFNAKGGAKGVGRATTEAVVISLVTILVIDFFISYWHYIQDQDSIL